MGPLMRSQKARRFSDSDRGRLNIHGVEKLNSYTRQVERMDNEDMAYADQLLRAILELIDKCKSLEELRESVARILNESK